MEGDAVTGIIREEQIGPCRLLLGDCLEILPTLEGVDAIVTDPPYGISYVKGKGGGAGAYRGSKKSAAESRHHEPVTGDDKPFDPSPLLRFENVLMFGANHYCHRLPEGKGRWLAWNKLEDLESFDSFSDVEFAWHSKGKVSRVCNYMWKGGLACRKNGEDNGRRCHPTQKPVGVMRWCIVQVGAQQHWTILDPYMGSGTTGIACLRMGMGFTGIEIEKGHFDTACHRISLEWGKKRRELPLEPQPRMVQGELIGAT